MCVTCDDRVCEDLGILSVCDTYDTGATNSTGDTRTYTIDFMFNGQAYTKTFDIDDGEPILIPLDCFNEDYLYKIEVTSDLDVALKFGLNNCAKFRTAIPQTIC